MQAWHFHDAHPRLRFVGGVEPSAGHDVPTVAARRTGSMARIGMALPAVLPCGGATGAAVVAVAARAVFWHPGGGRSSLSLTCRCHLRRVEWSGGPLPKDQQGGLTGSCSMAAPISDDALVIRGGRNRPADLDEERGLIRAGRPAYRWSASGLTVEELAASLPHGQIGVTTVAAVRSLGGDVARTSGRSPRHATLTGLSPEDMSALLTPTISNWASGLPRCRLKRGTQLGADWESRGATGIAGSRRPLSRTSSRGASTGGGEGRPKRSTEQRIRSVPVGVDESRGKPSSRRVR